MSYPKSCFVIIGYGRKPSYATGSLRELNLDETFEDLIKPVFDELRIDCYRAIDKNTSGSIDKLMLEEILNADLVVADLSTLNANVMWELGVRHALKPKHTFMICEKEQMSRMPFDINHFVVYKYTHTPDGIPGREAKRFKEEFKEVVSRAIADNSLDNDSPVYTFLGDVWKRTITAAADTGSLIDFKGMNILSATEIDLIDGRQPESFSELMNRAELAKKSENYELALQLFSKAKTIAEQNITLRDNLQWIQARLILCTYKSKNPTEKEAYLKAQQMLEDVKALQSNDIELLGLNGAVQKRLFELTSEEIYLQGGLTSYLKGYELKHDYYNGINACFMLYLLAKLQKEQSNPEWEDTNDEANSIRNKVLKICIGLTEEKGFDTTKDKVWIYYTIAEAYLYKGMKDKQIEFEALALKCDDSSANSSYSDQKKKIERYELV
ncbi:MAG: hypothetical protein IPJ31_06875 [Bacteroidetes bacterium]|nr:hypothetical protein [Bacteroidota bacterium]